MDARGRVGRWSSCPTRSQCIDFLEISLQSVETSAPGDEQPELLWERKLAPATCRLVRRSRACAGVRLYVPARGRRLGAIAPSLMKLR